MSSEPTIRELETVPCELCSSESFHPLFTGTDKLLCVPGKFNVVECSDCGFVYTNPRPKAEKLKDYYPETYGIYDPDAGQSDRIAIYHRRIAYNLTPSKLINGMSALDIGCGEGAFLTELKKLGWTCRGLEMDAKAVERAKTVRHLEVEFGTVEEAEYESDSFDLIVLSHLLEHVPHPRLTLQKIHGWLKPTGKIFITLPNCDCWERRRFKENWYPWDLPRHLSHFTIKTLSELLNETGYKVDKLRFLSGFYLLQSMRYKKSGSDECDRPTAAASTISQSTFKEKIKTFIFRLVLAGSVLLGRLKQGEVMEITASKK